MKLGIDADLSGDIDRIMKSYQASNVERLGKEPAIAVYEDPMRDTNDDPQDTLDRMRDTLEKYQQDAQKHKPKPKGGTRNEDRTHICAFLKRTRRLTGKSRAC